MTPDSIKKSLARWFDAWDLEMPPVYLVGGAVRDHLLCRPSNDLDLVCNNAGDFAQHLADLNRAALVHFEKKPGETCYRIVDRNDPDNFIDLVELRGGDIISDLARRDFTINAMAMPIHSVGRLGRLVDPHNGQSDLEWQIVRMVSPEAFADDPLRILRAWRFAAELEYGIDETTRARLTDHVGELSSVAVERIVYELFRILSTAKAGSWLRDMAQLTVLDSLFPEKSESSGTVNMLSVWDSGLSVLDECEMILSAAGKRFGEAARPVDEQICTLNHRPLLKLAALFYDIDFNYPDNPEGMAERIARRLKLSNRDRVFFQRVLDGSVRVCTEAADMKHRATRIGFFRTYGDEGVAAIVLAMAVLAADAAAVPEGLDPKRTEEIFSQAVLDYFGQTRPRLQATDLISGNDLIDLGMRPGPLLGAVLREVRRAQDEGKVTSREEALQFVRNYLLTT